MTPSPRSRLKRALTSVLVVVAALAVACVAGEGAVRLLAPQVTMFPRYIESKDYAVVLPPDTRILHSQGGRWSFVYNTNRLGKRGPYVPIKDRYDTENVVVLGDSFTFGVGVGDDQVYTKVMADELGPRFAVINGGGPGWGIDSEAKWYSEVGRLYAPTVVVLQFTANDPTDSYTGVARVSDGALVFSPYHGIKPVWQRLVSGSAILQRSHVFSLIRAAITPGTPVGQAQEAMAGSAGAEAHYVEMLQAFAGALAAEKRQLLFVSVTDDARLGEAYNVDAFPLIRAALQRLEQASQLRFVTLPLAEMRNEAGSPEGHQWGVGHHRRVGVELARQIRHQ